MTAPIPPLGALTSPHTYRHWAHLIIGGALATPYLMASLVLASLITDTTTPPTPTGLTLTLALAIGLTLITATALIPATRTGQHHLAHALGILHDTTPTSGRLRPTLWLHLHLTIGLLACVATMVALTEAALLTLAPLDHGTATPLTPTHPYLGPPLALLWLLALIHTIALTGRLLTKIAPHLLGPTPTDRLAAAQAHAHRLAERNRLARELHDGLGHALSVVTLQAATAARLLDTDPDFARQALTHIADTARTATADLDHALGLLRQDTPTPRIPPPDLTHLPHLTQATRHTGTDLTSHIDGPLDHIPTLLSRETYRITQEALTNALRHAPHQPLTLTLKTTPTSLTLTLTNPLPTPHRPRRRHPTRGGHGLHGMRERAHLIGATLTHGPHHDQWTTTLHLTWKDTR
ncbi:sensor histidine kinase [Nocardiopsis alba]|uniref:sensor histidine kinase n=1 Tax=Nocardiopsis alba TaxID=53437 RepID=UPI0036CE179B